MPVALIVACAAIGALTGLFVPKVAYRLSVDQDAPPRAGCAVCDRPFPPGQRGWVPWPARCPECRTRFGPPAWLTAAAGGLSCAVLCWALDRLGVVGPSVPVGGALPVLAAFVVLALAGVLLAVIDLACLRLPDLIVAVAGGTAFLLLALATALTSELGPLPRGLAGAAALGGGYLILALLPGGSIGFGDVKLAAVLGLLLGWLGWGAVLLGALLPHLINGPVALALLLTKRAGAKTELPLGPALLAGALAAVAVYSLTA